MRRILPLLGLALFCSQVVAEDIVDLGFNADALRLQYVHEFRDSRLQWDAGWLHHTDNGDVVHGGLMLADLASNSANKLEAGLGGRIVYTKGDLTQQDGAAVPVGGFVRFTPQRFNRLSLGASMFFAPDVLSIGDMKKYEEYAARVSYNVLRQADIYVGARYVKGEYKNAPSARYDTGMHIGMTLRF